MVEMVCFIPRSGLILPSGDSSHITTRLESVSNDAGIGLDIRPGGGALIFTTEGRFYFERFDRDTLGGGGTGYSSADLDNYRITPRLKVAWKFLPKTSVFLDAEGVLTQFPNSSVNAASPMSEVVLR